MNELLLLQEGAFPVDGRELHKQLGISTSYKDWFPRMCEYGFEVNIDFCSKMSESTGGRPAANHLLTLSMAKELCMIQRTDMGRQVRRYLIEVENAWNSPEQVMARALRLADATIAKLRGQIETLAAENQAMLPKAEYFDDLVSRNTLTNFRETAKQFGIKERKFIRFLIEQKYIYRDKRGQLMPTEKKGDALFSIRETKSSKTRWSGTQTMITPKGRETFRLLLQSTSCKEE